MRFRNNAFPLAPVIWLLSLGAPAPAQFQPGQWVGDLYMVGARFGESSQSWTLLDGGDKVHRAIPNVTKAADFPELCQSCGSEAWHSYWHGDALYTLADGNIEKDGEGRELRHHVFAKWEDGGWQLLGTLRVPRGDLLHFVPCDGGRFIVVSSSTDLFDDRRQDRSPFCVAAIQEGKGEMAVVSSIDHGQDDLRKAMAGRDCFGLAWHSDTIVTEGRATLVNRETGLYWVFSTENVALVKAGGIFRGATPEMIARGDFKSRDAVPCANPEKAGTVLLSAQDEGLFLAETENAWEDARGMWDGTPWEQRTEERDALISEILFRRLGEAMARSPLVVWYRIHPENGRVERLPAPPEGGGSTRASGDDDYWRPMPDGSVRMGWDPHRLDKLKAQVSEWAGGNGGGAAPQEADGAAPGRAGEAPPPDDYGADGGADVETGMAKGEDKGADKSGAPAG